LTEQSDRIGVGDPRLNDRDAIFVFANLDDADILLPYGRVCGLEEGEFEERISHVH